MKRFALVAFALALSGCSHAMVRQGTPPNGWTVAADVGGVAVGVGASVAVAMAWDEWRNDACQNKSGRGGGISNCMYGKYWHEGTAQIDEGAEATSSLYAAGFLLALTGAGYSAYSAYIGSKYKSVRRHVARQQQGLAQEYHSRSTRDEANPTIGENR